MKIIKLLLLIFLSLNLYSSDINLDNIIKQSKQQNKQIMVFFHMKHCGWCHKMINDTLENESIKKIINDKFVFVDIDVETSGNIIFENKTIDKINFARKYKVWFYPTTLIFENMKIIQRIKGYRNKNKFTNILLFISSNSYKDYTLKEFIINQEFNK
jgi:thioredoxin-related protein